ncbi:MAG: tetratricopeptide repeat protein [Gemmatimonadetes bacterium]|jgi:Tfp pilus assembly protein PilF|nr:tetratricopeptide repeat protein [Gemmatimonadota bacterium]MBT6147995.1 tetratricopeptide repeat protein [Gemmatimonadota bacterium]MBT7860450.1 tetratricopeptide repeat protein [Gemmatimonadota bacterium]
MFERSAKLEKVFRRHPGAPVFARLAEHALRRDRLMRAQVLCEEGCERFPDYPTGHVVLGRVYETQGLWEEARAAYDQGLRLDPDQPAVYRRLSRVYCELGNTTLALKCLESAARLDPLSESVSRQLEEMAAVARAQTPVETPVQAALEHGQAEVRAESVTAATTPDPVASGLVELATPAPSVPGLETDRPAEQMRTAAQPPGETSADGVTQDAEVFAQTEPEQELLPEPVPEVASSAIVEDPVETSETRPPTEPFSAVQPLPEWNEPFSEPDASTTSGRVHDISDDVTADLADILASDQTDGQDAHAPGPDLLPAPHVGDMLAQPGAGEERATPAELPDAFDDELDGDSGNEFHSEVAALGEGLFEESESEVEEAASAAPAQRARPAPRPAPAVESPVLPVVEPQVLPAVEPPVLPAVESPGLPAVETAIPAEVVTADPVVEPSEQEVTPAEPVVSVEPTPEPDNPTSGTPAVAGFARRADDSLRQLVADIDAEKSADEAVAEEESHPIATITLAQLYDRQGFGDRAAQIYQQILATDPTNASALAGLNSVSAAG